MDAAEIIQRIQTSKKKTPVKVYIKGGENIHFPNAKVFGNVVIGDWEDIEPVLRSHLLSVEDYYIETSARHSAIPLLDIKNLHARIEPGAIIRDDVEIGDQAIIMMGAIDNLVKGAAGQAVQNMNLLFGFREQEGLELVPMFP